MFTVAQTATGSTSGPSIGTTIGSAIAPALNAPARRELGDGGIDKKERKAHSGFGPHRVVKGSLAAVGVPGVVYTPEEGKNLPVVVFAHDWLTTPKNFHRFLQQLASWGVIVAAPATEGGALPNQGAFVRDLVTVVKNLPSVPFDTGSRKKVTMNPGDVTLMGVGMGGSCALVAAASASVRQVIAAYPAPTSPSPTTATARVTVPVLLVDEEEPGLLGESVADAVTRALPGRVAHTSCGTATAANLVERGGLRGLLVEKGKSKDAGLLRGLLVAAALREFRH